MLNTSIKPEPFHYEFGPYGSQYLDEMFEEELRFTKLFKATLERREKLPFGQICNRLEELFPKSTKRGARTDGGVYFIYNPKDVPYYVGKAEVLRDRIRPRRDAVRNLGISADCIKDIWIAWIIVTVKAPPMGGVKRVGEKQPITPGEGIRSALERYYYLEYKKLGHRLPGNEAEPEPGGVKFSPTAGILACNQKEETLFTLNKNF
jgi:hypothetical protein